MKLVNYHNHTYLCGHATGSIDDYIRSAMEKNIAVMGFSDHAPLPAHLREGITMAPDDIELYISEIEKKKIKYDNNIEILTGFEVDYPLNDTFPRKYFSDSRIDFLIGSCHFIDNWPFDHDAFIGEFDRRDINEIYSSYYSIIEDLVDSGLFDIIGHFDLIKKFGHRATDDFSATVETIAKKISATDSVVEINTSGLIKPVGEAYPSDEIIKILFNMNVPITLGSDSHAPEHVGYMFPEIIEKIKTIGYRKISGFRKRKRFDIIL